MSWKTTSVFFMGFSAGMVYVVACNGDNKTDSGMSLIDTASANPNPNPNPNPTGSGRAVIQMKYDGAGNLCWLHLPQDCSCPTGFTHVAWGDGENKICLED